MGCDYYIDVYLEIEHKNGISYYEFPTIRGYYPELDCFMNDSDDEDDSENNEIYSSIYKTLIDVCLTPKKELILFNNGLFVTEKIKNKYIQMIQNKIDNLYDIKYPKLTDTGILTNIDEIIKITKKEIRYER